MKSDWDDAPHYLRNPKKLSEQRTLLIASLVGTALTFGGLYLAGAKFDFNEHLRDAKATELAQQQPESPPPLEEVVPRNTTAEERFWASVKRDAENRSPAIKQTDFNDDNYTPKPLTNIVMPPAESSAPPSRQTQYNHTHIHKTAVWIEGWGNGKRYLAKWTAINNRIDGRSVCANHGRGSVDYRDCRKAAKQHFKNECRAMERVADSDPQRRQRYCSAANSFSPMG